jgi:hypothetical protein
MRLKTLGRHAFVRARDGDPGRGSEAAGSRLVKLNREFVVRLQDAVPRKPDEHLQTVELWAAAPQCGANRAWPLVPGPGMSELISRVAGTPMLLRIREEAPPILRVR